MAAIFLKNYHKKQKENLEKLKVFLFTWRVRCSLLWSRNSLQMIVNILIFYSLTSVHNCTLPINKTCFRELKIISFLQTLLNRNLWILWIRYWRARWCSFGRRCTQPHDMNQSSIIFVNYDLTSTKRLAEASNSSGYALHESTLPKSCFHQKHCSFPYGSLYRHI